MSHFTPQFPDHQLEDHDMRTDTTSWTTTLTAGAVPSATLEVAVNGGAKTGVRLRGVCYSPQPINGSSSLSPSLGDLFWDNFSGPGYSIDGWSALWQRDLPQLKALGINTLRVYNMMSRQQNSDGSWPAPWNSGHKFTHRAFLDLCWENKLFVLVGVALPQAMFWKSDYQADSALTAFWTNVLAETVTELASHPALIGFVIANEVDAANVSYCSATGPTPACASNAQFWWSQVNTFAGVVKQLAPGKLAGIANHDDPFICANAAAYMATCNNIDFWGVNTYQPASFDPVFRSSGAPGEHRPGFAGLTGAARKPVLITEYGFPVTGRPNPCDPSGITVSSASIQNVATVLEKMIPLAFAEPLNLGMYYFEYCDELWNQSAYVVDACGATRFVPPNVFTPYGGPPAAGFPNQFWDQDGFGLYGVARGGTLAPDAPIWNGSGYTQGPCLPIDRLTARTATVTAVSTAYAAIAASAASD